MLHRLSTLESCDLLVEDGNYLNTANLRIVTLRLIIWKDKLHCLFALI